MTTTSNTDRLRVDGSRLRQLAARPRDGLRAYPEVLSSAFQPKPVGPAGTGYLYGILFNTRAIKVGQTVDMIQRFRQHRADARPFGAFPIGVWSFGWYENYLADEAALIEHCARQGGIRVRNEYFLNLDWKSTYRFAASLAEPRATAPTSGTGGA